jgi:hypothetical protein
MQFQSDALLKLGFLFERCGFFMKVHFENLVVLSHNDTHRFLKHLSVLSFWLGQHQKCVHRFLLDLLRDCIT